MKRTWGVWIALACMVLGCQQPGGDGSPFGLTPTVTQKRLMTNKLAVEMICYVDPEKENPLNAKDYYFSASAESGEIPLFNYVVLAYAYMTKDGRGYTQVELTPALRYILENAKTFIKPLHQKGIKVLIEVRSGNFSDTQDGVGAGLAVMDMAAINELTQHLKILIDHYGIDGFDFNDIGGGRNSYPPFTENLTQFQSENPLYPNTLFVDEEGNRKNEEVIQNRLWREGGNNFSNFMQRLNEHLKESWTWEEYNGNSVTLERSRTILVRAVNHGNYLVDKIRDEYMPDAYSGADAKVLGNLRYIINDVPYDNTKPHADLWDETRGRENPSNSGVSADNQYSPFTINLSDQKDQETAELWADTFLWIDSDPKNTASENQNRYGVLYWTNLRPVSEYDNAAYLSYFSRKMFGRVTMLAPGGGNNQKTW